MIYESDREDDNSSISQNNDRPASHSCQGSGGSSLSDDRTVDSEDGCRFSSTQSRQGQNDMQENSLSDTQHASDDDDEERNRNEDEDDESTEGEQVQYYDRSSPYMMNNRVSSAGETGTTAVTAYDEDDSEEAEEEEIFSGKRSYNASILSSHPLEGASSNNQFKTENDTDDDDGGEEENFSRSASAALPRGAASIRGKVLKNLELADEEKKQVIGSIGNEVSLEIPQSSSMAVEAISGNGTKVEDALSKNESSSDDDLLISRRSKKKKKQQTQKKKTHIETKPPKKKIAASKKRNKALSSKKQVHDEEITATVVVEGPNSDTDVSEVVAVAEVISKKKRKRPPLKVKKKSKDRTDSSKKNKRTGSKSRKKKGMRRKRSDSDESGLSDSSSSVQNALPATSIIPHDKLQAAEQARDILIHSVQRTPIEISDSYTVRNFGRIKIEDGANAIQTMYSSSNALHPVGFSCDRYEFSPVHGRVIKMRCDILDGAKVRKRSKKLEAKDSDEVNLEPEASEKKRDATDGPIFRIMWGIGVDESYDARSFPFDLYSASTPLGGDVDAVAVPLGLDTVNVAPEPGMRVKVRFDSDIWYGGSIRTVNLNKQESSEFEKNQNCMGSEEKKKKKKKYNVQILYDDGSKEEASFPDPDIVLIPPGCEETAEGCVLNVTEIKNKAVRTVFGKTPLEAWGRALIQLGLIDEIMLEMAEASVAAARLEGLAEVKEKMEAVRKQRQEARARHLQRQKEKIKEENSEPIIVRVKGGKAIVPDDMEGTSEEVVEKDEEEKEVAKESEPVTSCEIELRERVIKLRKMYEDRLTASRSIAIKLANARICALGPFYSNPFFEVDDSLERMKNWLATVVRKEKSKMGSTGNRRKIVTATDLLERNAIFLNPDVERLIEGLPGTEFCPRYVFHELRGNGAYSANQSWVHEEQLRQEREQQKKQKRAHEDEAKASYEREKELKRKARENERNCRKKQRLEELEEKKKAREEERLSRLSIQVDERLFKEACFQRERVVLLASKLIGKEFLRRRKTAEVIAAHVVENTSQIESEGGEHLGHEGLPPLSKQYDVDVLRVWNFIYSYRDAFEQLGDLKQLPSLDALQSAIDNIKTKSIADSLRKEAIDLLTNIAIALCKPISIGVIKTLSTVLSTVIQEKDSIKTSESGDETIPHSMDPDSYPVNVFTWREVTRLALLSDALNELGYSKQEQAHLLRGYRSGGHPNSKEAKRLRRGEDYALALHRQALLEIASNTPLTSSQKGVTRGLNIVVDTPCEPTAKPVDWIYFLHNVKSLPANAVTGIKSNLRKARNLLKETILEEKKKESILTELQRNLSILEHIDTSYTSSTETMNVCDSVRQNALRLLEEFTGEAFLKESASEVVCCEKPKTKKMVKSQMLSCEQYFPAIQKRQKYSKILKSLICTEEDYKKCMLHKEEYMAVAIKLKEEQERKKNRNFGDEEEDDEEEDEDEEDEDEEEDKDKEKQSEESEHKSKVVTSVVKTNIELNENTLEKVGTIGKKTIYDDFCGDQPYAPDLIRRCLAVLRTLCLSTPAEPFIYPVDPQTNQKYYEAILKPISLYDIGKFLQGVGNRLFKVQADEEEMENIVTKFGRDVRLISQNCACFSNVGGAIISSAEEMIRIFERLFFDWVLCPAEMRPPLNMLDDDRCVEYHPSDEGSLVLLCDGCEGKFNMSRLDPPLLSVPQGDWYCPRCIRGRSWASVDPRIGRKVTKVFASDNDLERSATFEVCGVITKCIICMSESSSSLLYGVHYENGVEERWPLETVDLYLNASDNPIPPIQCVEAITESPGYGSGAENGLIVEVVPIPLNPRVSDTAAQKAVSSTVFQDTIVCSAGLLVTDVDEICASEWLRLLILLVMKCVTSDPLQAFVSKLENEANLKVAANSSKYAQIKSVSDLLPNVTDDECNSESKGVIEPGANDESGSIIRVIPEHNKKKFASDSDEEIEWDDNNEVQIFPETVRRFEAETEWNDKSKLSRIEVEKNEINENNIRPLVIRKDSDTSSSNTKNSHPVNEALHSEAAMNESLHPESGAKDLEKKMWFEALTAKKQRQKAREDSFLAQCIKSQMKCPIASFEEDNISQVVDTSLTSKIDVVGLASCRCSDLYCDFCGLPDVALGTPLVRVPNEKEWIDMMQFSSKKRTYLLVAEIDLSDVSVNDFVENDNENGVSTVKKIDGNSITQDKGTTNTRVDLPLSESSVITKDTSYKSCKEESNVACKIISDDRSISRRRVKILSVTITVGGKLVSTAIKDAEKYGSITNDGMVEFMPRNVDGFQNEMNARMEDDLPFITGSLSAHECCALTVHRSRVEKMIQERKEKLTEKSEKDYGNTCGRTLSLGTDKVGRSYWKFDSDPKSLFVLENRSDGSPMFLRFREPESITSVIVCLREEEPVNEIKRAFPNSVALLLNRKWVDVLQKRLFTRNSLGRSEMKVAIQKNSITSGQKVEMVEDLDPFEKGEDVLIESFAGKLLWNASIVTVSKSKKTKKILGYKVHYTEWSSRFDEWVEPIRVVEPSENNLLVQDERLEEVMTARLAMPETLNQLQAKSYIDAPHRVIASSSVLNFSKVATLYPGATPEEKLLATLRSAILLVEAALPIGAVDGSVEGNWKPDIASSWRSMVATATFPGTLIGCLILLENVISSDWLRPNAEHLLSSLPRPWKAVNEASVSSIALRLWVLDSGVKYSLVVKK